MITVTKIMEQVYVLKDQTECCANLVIGTEKALLFDTGSGVDDMLKAVRIITNLPLLIIASHGHFDHIGGSAAFDKVYLSAEDWTLLDVYTDEILNKWLCEMVPGEERENLAFQSNQWKQMRKLDFKKFDLGNLECQVLPLKGHTKGSIGIYIPCLKLLLSGDALTPVMCLHFYNHLTKEVQIETLKRVEMLDFDYYLTSHHDRSLPKSMVGRMIDCIKRSNGRKHYKYQYPRPPYTKGWFYLDSIEEEPIGLVVDRLD